MDAEQLLKLREDATVEYNLRELDKCCKTCEHGEPSINNKGIVGVSCRNYHIAIVGDIWIPSDHVCDLWL